MHADTFQTKALQQEAFSTDEALAILNYPQDQILPLLQAAYEVRRHFVGNTVQVQMLMNAKSGLCSEDCHYCSQSCVSTADIQKYPLKTTQELLEGAKAAKKGQHSRI